MSPLAILGAINTPVGRIVAGGVVGVLVVWIAWSKGGEFERSRAEVEISRLEGSLAASERDRVNAAAAAAEGEALFANLQAENTVLEELVNAQREDLAADPSDRCLRSDEQFGRLCNVAGADIVCQR